MALMKRAAAVLTTARQTLITAPAGKEVIVFSGTVSNKDTASKTTHLVTIEVQVGGAWRVLVKDIPVSYNSSFVIPKIVMQAGDVLAITGSVATHLDAYLSYVER